MAEGGRLAIADKVANNPAGDAQTIIGHLSRFAESQIRDLGKRGARSYLRRCIAHWREHYGDDLAADMERRIRAMFSSG